MSRALGAPSGPNYILVYLQVFSTLADDRRFTLSDFRVLMKMLGKIGMRNRWADFNQVELGKSLGMKQPHVSASLKKLTDASIILRGDKTGKGHLYQLNARFGWRGITEERHVRRDAAPRLVLLPAPRGDEALPSGGPMSL